MKWTCVGGHDLWQDNTFAFELSESEEGTKLLFTQTYTDPISDEDFGAYNFNWAYYLQSLQEYCQTGEGKPFNPKR